MANGTIFLTNKIGELNQYSKIIRKIAAEYSLPKCDDDVETKIFENTWDYKLVDKRLEKK